MPRRSSKLLPALAGGAVLGAFSSIPYVSLANVACCSWAIVGGGVAAYLLIKRSSRRRVRSGDGAMAGFFAGLIGSLIILIINLPLVLNHWPELVANLQQQAEQRRDPQAQETLHQLIAFAQGNRVLAMLLIGLIFTLITTGMATLGGLIGVALFEKRKTEAGGRPPS